MHSPICFGASGMSATCSCAIVLSVEFRAIATSGDNPVNNPQISNAAALLGRIFMSAIFITAGYGKIGGYAGAAGYMAKMGVPGALLPLVILTELGGGLLILVGFQTRIVAFLLAGFSLLSGLIFHYSPAYAGKHAHRASD